MSDQVPYPAPAGFMWTRGFLGLGPWRLAEDPQWPLPPKGYRYRPNPITAKPELVAVVGKGVDFFSDGKSHPAPATQHPCLMGTVDKPRYVLPAPIPPEKIGKGVNFLEGTSTPKPGSDKFKRDQAIFG